MQLHENVKIDADAFSELDYCANVTSDDLDHEMTCKPSTEATAAWIRLARLQSRVLDAVEHDLKKAGFPPLA